MVVVFTAGDRNGGDADGGGGDADGVDGGNMGGIVVVVPKVWEVEIDGRGGDV